MNTNRSLLKPVIEISEDAAVAILRIYDTDFGVEEKDDESPLTKADLASHQIIVDALGKLTPDIPVLSEESRELPFSTRSQWQRYWLVDPLDGTKEFVKRNGEFTVNIALIDNHEPILGVVYVPVRHEIYYAARSEGAWYRDSQGRDHAIQVRQIGDELVVVGSRSHAGERLRGYLQRLGSHQLVSMGSSLKFCLVAHGQADMYPRLGLTSEWDTAAAQCVVEQAGGQVTDTAMQPLRYNTKDSLLNPEFFVFGDGSRDWSAYLDEDGDS